MDTESDIIRGDERTRYKAIKYLNFSKTEGKLHYSPSV